ncbi:Triose-phosphate Transporter [Entomortierella beljakovae]|nr:Triose-phosphate Transporter [Entomortierella beljakovae]
MTDSPTSQPIRTVHFQDDDELDTLNSNTSEIRENQETQETAYQDRRSHRRTDSVSSSESSDDGIEWETPDNNFEYRSESAVDDYYSDEDERSNSESDDQDTRRLLSSSNARIGGLGMGIRAGEIGTGTTIGLDFEQDTTRDREDYDALPLTNVDQRSRKHPNPGDSHRERTSKRNSYRSHRRSTHSSEPFVMGLGEIQTEQEKLIAKKQLRVKMFWNIFYVLAWYGFSTSLSFYNKWLFSPQHYNFGFPLFTTCLHMVVQFTLASLTLTLIPSLRPSSRPTLRDFGVKLVPCAAASGLDIGLSNNSLKSITLAFYTMCKSSSLAFVLLFAFAFKLEKPTWKLAGVIGVICIGLFMMVMSEVDFVLSGFIQVMLASVLGGLRWSLTQILLERSDARSGSLTNPISTIFFLSPIMGVCLCIVAGIAEGYGNIFSSEFFQTVWIGLDTLSRLLLGGIIAFAMVLAEFNLIARTSVVSLSVLGIEVVTIIISSLVFHDQLTIVNILGLIITLSGIGFYHFMKLRELETKARKAAKEISHLNHISAANHDDEGFDPTRVYERQRKRGSSRSLNNKSSRPENMEGDLNIDISERETIFSSEALLEPRMIGSDGLESSSKNVPLIRVDSSSTVS